MSAGAGITGGFLDAGIMYMVMKDKVARLEAEIRAKTQKIDELQTEVQIQKSAKMGVFVNRRKLTYYQTVFYKNKNRRQLYRTRKKQININPEKF